MEAKSLGSSKDISGKSKCKAKSPMSFAVEQPSMAVEMKVMKRIRTSGYS